MNRPRSSACGLGSITLTPGRLVVLKCIHSPSFELSDRNREHSYVKKLDPIQMLDLNSTFTCGELMSGTTNSEG